MPPLVDEPYALPSDPTLAAVASAMEDTGQWSWVVDDHWRIVYATTAARITYAGVNGRLASFGIGHHFFGREQLALCTTWRFGPNSADSMGVILEQLGPLLLEDTPGGAAELKRVVDPQLSAIVDRLRPSTTSVAASSFVAEGRAIERSVDIPVASIRIRRADGTLAGTLIVFKPAASMAVLGAYGSMGDRRHFELMQQVSKAGRRPAAILFADLEGSSALARRLSTASYFALGRRLIRAADSCVIEAGGLVGRHVGDGIVAFFLVETAGSESAAARSCIEAARTLRTALADVAAHSNLEPEEVVLRFGLHWGSKLYVGAVTTAGRSEVTALGDEVNEAARIEACATGGRTLASKDLLERLTAPDAQHLRLDPDRIVYTALANLATATEKARRDAPAISVCEV